MKVRLLAAALAAMMMNLATGAPSGASGPGTRIFTDSAGREVEVPATTRAPSGHWLRSCVLPRDGKLSGSPVDFPRRLAATSTRGTGTFRASDSSTERTPI